MLNKLESNAENILNKSQSINNVDSIEEIASHLKKLILEVYNQKDLTKQDESILKYYFNSIILTVDLLEKLSINHKINISPLKENLSSSTYKKIVDRILHCILKSHNNYNMVSENINCEINYSLDKKDLDEFSIGFIKNFDFLIDEIIKIKTIAISENISSVTRLEDNTDVIEFFHKLLKINKNKISNENMISDIKDILNDNDIEIISYKTNENNHLFNFIKANDSDNEIVQEIKPALVRNGQLILKGLVSRP